MRRRLDGTVYGHRGAGDGAPILLANRLGKGLRRGSLERHSPAGAIAGKASGDGFLFEMPLDRKVDERLPERGEFGRRGGPALDDRDIAAGVHLIKAGDVPPHFNTGRGGDRFCREARAADQHHAYIRDDSAQRQERLPAKLQQGPAD